MTKIVIDKPSDALLDLLAVLADYDPELLSYHLSAVITTDRVTAAFINRLAQKGQEQRPSYRISIPSADALDALRYGLNDERATQIADGVMKGMSELPAHETMAEGGKAIAEAFASMRRIVQEMQDEWLAAGNPPTSPARLKYTREVWGRKPPKNKRPGKSQDARPTAWHLCYPDDHEGMIVNDPDLLNGKFVPGDDGSTWTWQTAGQPDDKPIADNLADVGPHRFWPGKSNFVELHRIHEENGWPAPRYPGVATWADWADHLQSSGTVIDPAFDVPEAAPAPEPAPSSPSKTCPRCGRTMQHLAASGLCVTCQKKADKDLNDPYRRTPCLKCKRQTGTLNAAGVCRGCAGAEAKRGLDKATMARIEKVVKDAQDKKEHGPGVDLQPRSPRRFLNGRKF